MLLCSCDEISMDKRTDGMDGFMLEERADHGVAYHCGGDSECMEFQGGQPVHASGSIGEDPMKV